MARDYRAPRNNHRLEIYCYNYGKRGHLVKDCRALNGGTYGQTGQVRLNTIILEGASFNVEEQ